MPVVNFGDVVLFVSSLASHNYGWYGSLWKCIGVGGDILSVRVWAAFSRRAETDGRLSVVGKVSCLVIAAAGALRPRRAAGSAIGRQSASTKSLRQELHGTQRDGILRSPHRTLRVSTE